MQATKTPSQPDAVVEMVRSQRNAIELIREILDETQADYVADERVDLRYPVCVPIEATLYNDQGQPCGEPFTAVTKDISAGGIAFLRSAAVTDRYVVITFPWAKQHSDERVVVEVRYCRELGPLWQIGGRFLVDW
jgi:PilZ domain